MILCSPTDSSRRAIRQTQHCWSWLSMIIKTASLTSCSSFMRSNMFSMSTNACWIILKLVTRKPQRADHNCEPTSDKIQHQTISTACMTHTTEWTQTCVRYTTQKLQYYAQLTTTFHHKQTTYMLTTSKGIFTKKTHSSMTSGGYGKKVNHKNAPKTLTTFNGC